MFVRAVCGPMQTHSFGNHLYFVTFIDDFSRHAWVYPLKKESKVFLCFKQFISMAENMLGCKMGTLRSYQGREYVSKEFDAFLAERGIKHQLTVPYTPHQNGVAEKKTGLSWRWHDAWSKVRPYHMRFGLRLSCVLHMC